MLRDMLRAVEFGDVDLWAEALHTPMRAAAIDTRLRMAAFLANVAHETGGGRVLVENLSYSADRIRAVWPSRFPDAASADPFARNPEGLANKVYGGRMGNSDPGDGWRFRGRGLIQVTGRTNYTMLAKHTGRSLYSLPEWLETKDGAAKGACLYWMQNGLNATADTGDIAAVRRRVNGGTVGLDDVARRYARAMGGG
jgi:putative chitinase